MASSPSSEGVDTVDVGAAKSLVGSGHLYLDVRTIEEFNKGHPENALNLPYMFFTPQGRVTNPQFLEQVSSICSKDDFIVVVCGVYYASGLGRDRNYGYEARILQISRRIRVGHVSDTDTCPIRVRYMSDTGMKYSGCQSGVRSHHACVDLLNAGFKNVKNMGGGYAAWVDNGFAIKIPQQ